MAVKRDRARPGSGSQFCQDGCLLLHLLCLFHIALKAHAVQAFISGSHLMSWLSCCLCAGINSLAVMHACSGGRLSGGKAQLGRS